LTDCLFNTKYFDYKKNEPVKFSCTEKPIENGYCIFHDEKFADDKKIVKLIEERIKNSVSKKIPLFCIGYKVPTLRIKEFFSAPIYFNKSEFNDVNFSGSKFEQADFSGTIFNKADFSDTSFEEADFLGMKCKNVINFSKSKFKKANFSEAIFQSANFSKCKFNKAHFLDTRFKTADFSLTNIENSDYFGAVFETNVNFIGASITMSKFEKTKFLKGAIFVGANLNKVNFPQSEFNSLDFSNAKLQTVSLRGTIYHANANFSLSKLEKVDFFNAQFNKKAVFSETLLNEVVFPNTVFRDIAKFDKTIFRNVQFNKSEFQGVDFADAKFETTTSFTDVLFRDQSRVNFDVDDLSKVSFMNTKISNIRISDKARWGGKNGYEIIDEELLTDSTPKTILESVIAIYRNLRKNYERRNRNEEAEKFFAREVELKRRYMIGENKPAENLDLLEKKIEELTEELYELKKRIEKLEHTNKSLSE